MSYLNGKNDSLIILYYEFDKLQKQDIANMNKTSVHFNVIFGEM